MTDQSQKAGADSRQYQAGRDINVGVTAEEVVNITRAEVARSVDQLTAAAKEIAEARTQALGDRIIRAFEGRSELFQAFADPDFQFSLRDAARAAASTDDEHTEQLLVDLLTNRAEEGGSTRVRLATSQAIRAADKLSQEALNGLTALWVIGSLTPTTATVEALLANAQQIAEALLSLGLPSGKGWVSDLDALNLARVAGGFLERRRYNTIVAAWARDHLVTGIDPSASEQLIESATKAIPELRSKIFPHPLKPGFLRLAGKDQNELLAQLSDVAASCSELQQLIGQNGYGMQDNTATAELAKTVNDSAPITTVAEWWDNVPATEMTIVGDVIGFVNARRYIPFEGAVTVTDLLHIRSQ
jgi:hypothetical protein